MTKNRSARTIAARFGFMALLTLSLFLGACAQKNSTEDPQNSGAESAQVSQSRAPSGTGGTAGPPASAFSTARVEVRTRSIQVGGRLEPQTRIVHSMPVAGVIRKVGVSPGDRVSQGQTLFTIERDEVGQTYLPVPVTARVTGVVAEVDVTADEEVSSGETGVIVIGVNGYRLRAQVSDKDVAGVRVGQKVTADLSNSKELRGTLTVRSQEPDYDTGLFSVTFDFPASPDTFVGQFVLVNLPTAQARGIFVPRDAVVRRYGRYFVWTVDEKNSLQRREVQIGESFGDETQITAGLQTGERYLTRPTGREREGTPVPENTQ